MIEVVEISRNPALCDGTPRRAKGYVASMRYDRPATLEERSKWPRCRATGKATVYAQSPPMKTEAQARMWVPESYKQSGRVKAKAALAKRNQTR